MLSQQEFLEKCWEAEVLITSLLRLTENKAIAWECLEYEPPALIEATDLFLSQKLVVRTEFEGDPYQAELLETIEVKPGKGSLDLSIFIGEEPRNREESIERYITFFPENLVKPFSDLLFKLVGDSVARSPSWDNSQYVYQRFPAELRR